MRQGKPQDPFGLDRVRRAGDIVKRAGTERLHVSVPFGQVREDNDRGAPGGGS